MKRWKIGIYVYLSCGYPWKDSHVLNIKSCLFICYSLIGLVDTSPCLFSELGILWAYPLDGSLKSWNGRCAVQTLCSSGICWELGIPSWLYGAVFMTQVCLSHSYLYWCRYFLIYSMCSCCSANFYISFRGNCFMCSCTLNPWKEGRSGDTSVNSTFINTMRLHVRITWETLKQMYSICRKQLNSL